MRLPIARLLLALLFLSACGEEAEDVDTNIARDLKYARVRVLGLVGDTGSVDAVLTSGEAPPQAFGDVHPGSVTPFRNVEAGDCTAFLVRGGPPLAEAKQSIQEGKRYTVVLSGLVAAGAAAPPAIAWAEEEFAAVEGKARVRFVLGDPASEGGTATLAGSAIAEDLKVGQLGAFRDVDPGSLKLEVTRGTDSLATFQQVVLKAGEIHTLALVKVPNQGHPQLVDVLEKVDGDATSTVLDPEGIQRPTAMLRFVHLSPGTAAIDVKAGATEIGNGLVLKQIVAPLAVPIDSQITVQSEGVELLTPQKLDLQANGQYTAALVGSGGNRRVVVWNDAHGAISGPSARFAHALAGAPPIPLPASQAEGSALFPATMPGAVSAYQSVPAGPIDLVVQISGGTQTLRIGRYDGVIFPADTPVTAVLLGSFAAPPAVSSSSLVLIDDAANVVLADVAASSET